MGLLRPGRRIGDINMASSATLGLAVCATNVSDFRRAASLHGGADALMADVGGEWTTMEKQYRELDLATMRANLGVDFDRLYETARSLPIPQIYELGLLGCIARQLLRDQLTA
jgi:hypothetical protein